MARREEKSPMSIASHRFDNAKRRRSESHSRQAMLTPSYVIEPIREMWGSIGLDPCTEPNNPLNADQFFCPPVDGCSQPWNAETVFCNPPYGEVRTRWVNKCIEEGKHRQVILLIPSHTETRIFQKAMLACTTMIFIRSRLRFGVLRSNGRQEAASHGSALFGFNVDLSLLSSFGVVMMRAEK